MRDIATTDLHTAGAFNSAIYISGRVKMTTKKFLTTTRRGYSVSHEQHIAYVTATKQKCNCVGIGAVRATSPR